MSEGLIYEDEMVKQLLEAFPENKEIKRIVFPANIEAVPDKEYEMISLSFNVNKEPRYFTLVANAKGTNHWYFRKQFNDMMDMWKELLQKD